MVDWVAILIAVVSLLFAAWQGARQSKTARQTSNVLVDITNSQKETREINTRMLHQLRRLAIADITNQLAADSPMFFIKNWLSFAAGRKFVQIETASTKQYDITQEGREFIDALDSDLLRRISERQKGHPDDDLAMHLLNVNLDHLENQLTEYNDRHSSRISLETTMGTLAAFLDPDLP